MNVPTTIDAAAWLGKYLEGADGDTDLARAMLGAFAEALMRPRRRCSATPAMASAATERENSRNGYRLRPWDTRVGTRSSWPCPSSAGASTAPSSCSSRGGGPNKPWCRWSVRPTWKGSRRAGSTTWSRPWASTGSPSPRSRAWPKSSTRWSPSSRSARSTRGPYRYLWIDALTQRVREGGRVVNVSAVIATAVNARGQARDRRPRHRHDRGHRGVDGVPAGPGGPGAQRGRAGHLRRPRGHQGRHRPGLRRGLVAAVPHPLHGQPRLSLRQGELAHDRHLGALDLRAARPRHHLEPAGRRHRQADPGRASATSSPTCSTRPTTSWPSAPSRPSTGDRSAPTTPRSDSTRRSAGAPTSWASSPTAGPSSASSARSSPNRPTSGPSPGAT